MENNKLTDSERTLAIEELKILSSIIGRIENAIYQKQGWLFTLITGLALALLKDNPLIYKQQFAVISIAITLVFWVADAIQRVPVHRAILRSEKIEKTLRTNNNYNGPLISTSLDQKNDIKEFREVFLKFRVLVPYAFIILIVIIISYYAPK